MSWRGPALVLAAALALAAGPGRPGRHPSLALGEMAASKGQFAEAERIYRSILAEEPGNARAASELGALYASQGRCADAAAMFDGIRAHRLFKADDFLAEGDCAMRIGDHAGAAERFEEAVALSPRRTRGWVQLAVAREGMGDLEGALLALEELELVDRTQVDADYLRARLALGTPTFDVAYGALRRAEQDGEAGRIALLARLLEAQADLLAGAPEAANRAVTEAIRLDRTYPPALVLRAEVARRLGNPSSAELVLQMPGARGVPGPLQLAVRARIAVDLGELDQAAELLDAHPNRVDPERVASAWYLERARGGDLTSLEALYDAVRLPRNGDLELLIPLETP
jgi:tetratricopeptide (TPR) repeat protein